MTRTTLCAFSRNFRLATTMVKIYRKVVKPLYEFLTDIVF